MAEYEVYLTDDAGRRITIIENFAFLSISRLVKGYGTVHIGIPFRDFKVYPAFLPDRRIEVWRSPRHGATLREEGSFFLRKYNVYTREDGLEIIEFWGRSPLDILRRQTVVSSTPSKYNKTDFIDDMMKEIVTENFISPAQTAPSGELSVDGTDGKGPSISHSFYGTNVLDVLKDLRDISISLNEQDSDNRRIYFDVVRGSPLNSGGFGYIFRTYADLRGTDRTNDVEFSVENGNLSAPSYFEDHLDSETHATVLSQTSSALNGDVSSADRYLSRWNDIRVSQQSAEGSAALNTAKANQMLQQGRAEKALNVTFVDSPGSSRQPRSLYGVDWDLGDLLPVRYAGKIFNVEVAAVHISINENGEENIVGKSNPRVVTQAEFSGEGIDEFTVVLLHMDGTDASTTFTDESGKTWTAQGNAQIDTAQSVFGGAAGLFDGTGDYVTTPDHADWSSWRTIDFRVRFNGDPGTGVVGFVQQRADNNNWWSLFLSNNELVILVYSGGVSIVDIRQAWNPSTATWYHVAIVRNGNDYLHFIDGVQSGSTITDASTIPDFAGELRIGRHTDSTGTNYDLNGWMDELRISNIARWTANFTPPTEAYG